METKILSIMCTLMGMEVEICKNWKTSLAEMRKQVCVFEELVEVLHNQENVL